MKLVIDAGNTRTKWAVFDPYGQLADQGYVYNSHMQSFLVPQCWLTCSTCAVGCVADESIARHLKMILNDIGLSSQWLNSKAFSCGVENSYLNPSRLGIDRWASLVASWNEFFSPCIVVSAGTAVTIDALSLNTDSGHGVFLGGIIIPGIRLMHDSLVKGTANVNEISGKLDPFPKSTDDAVHTGSLYAISGAIKIMFEHLFKKTSMLPQCIINGGDSPLLLTLVNHELGLENNVIISDNLVMRGLFMMESECQ